jgi:hypothetical protein
MNGCVFFNNFDNTKAYRTAKIYDENKIMLDEGFRRKRNFTSSNEAIKHTMIIIITTVIELATSTFVNLRDGPWDNRAFL